MPMHLEDEGNDNYKEWSLLAFVICLTSLERKKEEGRKEGQALASVVQWIECQLANQRVASLIPSQGTCLGCGPGTQ